MISLRLSFGSLHEVKQTPWSIFQSSHCSCWYYFDPLLVILVRNGYIMERSSACTYGSSRTKPYDTDERQGLKFVWYLGRCGSCSSSEQDHCFLNLLELCHLLALSK